MAIFHVLEYFFQKALQYNEVPSVIIRSFFTAILVDTPKLCCVISKGGGRGRGGAGTNWSGEKSIREKLE